MLSLFETLTRFVSHSFHVSAAPEAESAPFVAPELESGQRWKDLIIRERLGKGSFGTVYRAFDSKLNREVALKFLSTAEALHEGKLLAQIHDDGVVSVHTIDEDAGVTALRLELASGTDLQSYIAKRGRLDAVHAAIIGSRICRALATVHRAGLLHRDIKTQNVILTNDGRTVLVDFGLGGPQGAAGGVMGTLPYMAPELLTGGAATRSADLYALGVLLFHLVSADYPVMADSFEGFCEAHRKGIRRHLLDVVLVPAPFAAIVERATAPDPAARFASAGEMFSALEAMLRDRPSVGGRIHRQYLYWATAGVSVAALAFFGWSWRDRMFRQGTETVLERLDSAIAVYDDPSLSSDGRIAVFASDKAGNGDMDVWVKYVGTNSSRVLTAPGYDEVEPTVSSDGTMVAYRSERDGAIYLNSTLGGEERRLATSGRHPRFSPDGRTIAYWTGEEGNLQSANARSWVVPVTGGPPQRIASEFADCRFPSWSPDGRYLLVTATRDSRTPPADSMDWWLIPMTRAGSPRKLDFYPKLRAMGIQPTQYPPHWSGERVVFGARRGESSNIWQVGLRSGRIANLPRPITFGTDWKTSPWSLADGTLAFATSIGRINVWSFPGDGSRDPALKRETAQLNFDLHPQVSADGTTLLFTRMAEGRSSIWLRNLGQANEHRIPLPDHVSAVLSRDGTRLIYTLAKAAQQPLTIQDIGSGDQRTVCADCGVPLDWAPDNRHVLFLKGPNQVFILDLVSGRQTPLSGYPLRPVLSAAVSQRNSVALALAMDADTSEIAVGRMIDWESGTLGSPKIVTHSGYNDKPAWARGGALLYYLSSSDGFGCVWSQRFNKDSKPIGSPFAIKHFHSARLSTSLIAPQSLNLASGGGRLFLSLDDESGGLWIQRPRRAGKASPD